MHSWKAEMPVYTDLLSLAPVAALPIVMQRGRDDRDLAVPATFDEKED
jgi:hypothetical protein